MAKICIGVAIFKEIQNTFCNALQGVSVVGKKVSNLQIKAQMVIGILIVVIVT